MIEIVNLADRMDLLPATAQWTWEEWGRSAGLSLEAAIALRTPGPDAFEKCFVLLDDGEPAAMASLARLDMDERPELTPWLAGVYVDPPFRGRGHGVHVVRKVEAAAVGAGVSRLWLYSNTAEGLYRKLGWHDHEVVHRPGKKATLVMRRDLAGESGASPPG